MKGLKLSILLIFINLSVIAQTVSNDTMYCVGNDAKIIVYIQNYDSLKWQYNTGTSFMDCSLNTNFTNTNDDTLLIPNIQFSLNNYKYRCIIYNYPDTIISDTLTILVSENVNSDFSFYNGIDGVVFNADNNYGTIFNWTFGDDSIATGQDVTHLYENLGVYQTCLVASHSGYCNDTICKQVEVNCFFPSNVSLPPDTFVNPNQDFYYEINDVFEEYYWNYGTTLDGNTNIISIDYNTLMPNYHINVSLSLDTNCYFYYTFDIEKYTCKDFSVVFNSTPSLYNINELCPGEEVNFEFDYINTFGNPYQIDSISSIHWSFNDETPVDTGNSVTHVYNNSGAHYVNVYAFDEYGCKSIPTNQDYIFISDNIDFTGTNTNIDTIFLSDTIFLQASANQIINNSDYILSQNDTIIIDDGTGVSLSSYLYVDINDTITSQDFIKNICIDMEHSYMGDLNIELICPDPVSNTITLHSFSNGGSTFLGDPIDDDNNLQHGIGYNYCFNMQAAETWATASSIVTTLPAGDYLPSSSFDDLTGCPTHGIWQLKITDNWASDNGYIFNWSLEFDSNIVQNQNVSLSGYWQGENIDDTSSVFTFAVPSSTGLHAYTYTAENENGCLIDTTIYVYVDFPYNVESPNNDNYKIFPNPVNDKINIISNSIDIEKVQILDVTGKIVKQLETKQLNNISIDISDLKKGIYFIKINNSSPIKIIKI